MFSANDVKELREKTGAGMMDCKKALEACEGNQDKAVDWLREKGIAKAAKKESRIAAEGTVDAVSNDNEAIIFEVNCETDFVTKNEKFYELVKELREALISDKCKNTEEALEVKLSDGKTISERIIEETATIGEKISFRRFELVEKTDSETFGAYTHMNSKIAVLVVLDGGNADVAKDVAMHAAAMRPKYLNIESVPTEDVDHEREVQKQIAINEGKPANIAEKMVEGRIKKFYKEVCLTEQPFVKNDDMSVSEYVKSNGGQVKSMVRYEVGEGMQKREENFADEVAKQMA